MIDPDSPDQIVMKVKEILANKEKAREISVYARTMVEKKYDWDNIAKDMRTKVFGAVLK